MRLPVKSRFMRYVEVVTESGCWIWLGALDGGYGVFSLDGRKDRANRAAYKLFKGAIPSEKQVLHVCDVACCVNPAHLEPVTMAENTRRGDRHKRREEVYA